MKRQPLLVRCLGILAIGISCLLLPRSAIARDIGAESPTKCGVCACKCPIAEPSAAGTTISRTEGNLTERVDLLKVMSGAGPTLTFSALYNSYNADGSRVQLDTVMGYGWTHSYNVFLFSQVGSMFRFDGEGRVTRYQLGAGGTFTAAPGYFETLVKNADGSFTLTQKDQTTYTFELVLDTPFQVVGPVHRLTTIVDRNGNMTRLSYAGGNLVSVTDTYGRRLTFTYTAQQKVATVTDSGERVTRFQYDTTGRMLTAIIDPTGHITQYAYNDLYQLTGKVDRDGRAFSYTYTANEPSAVNDSSGSARATLSNSTNWATDGVALARDQSRVYLPATTSNTDGRGNVWQYEYDSHGYLTRVVAPDGATTEYTYDPGTLMVSSVTDPDGHTTAYQYDARGNRTTMTDALGHVTRYTYEPVFNMMTSMTDPRGRITRYTYDAHGNRIQDTDPLGHTRSWTYDGHGNVLSETDQNGHTTTSQYDSVGNRVRVTDALSNVTTLTYDPVGNLLSRTDANGHTFTYQYDGLNRQIVETDPAGHDTLTEYDGEGNRVTVTDRNGHSTGYEYDERQRLTAVTDALGNPDVQTYDGNDNRTSLTDRNGHVTQFVYDVQDRLIETIDALGSVTTTIYDAAGNAVSQTDANGHTTTNTYDALNRRATTTDAAGEVTRTQYDGGTLDGCSLCGVTPGSSLVTQTTDANGKVIYFKYDALDRLIKVVHKVGDTSDTITPNDAVVTTTYDPVGNVLSLTQPNGNTTTAVYDPLNRRITETNAAGDITRITYDGVGNVIRVTSPNGNVTSIDYDALDHRIRVTDSAGLVESDTYDAVANQLARTDGNGNTTRSQYDALNRVITVIDPLGLPSTTDYDAVGNVLAMTDRSGNTTTNTYDAINRRVSTADALGNVTSDDYDGVGNRVTVTDANGDATLFQYDEVNRLTRETYADGLFRSYAYDGVGHVIRRTDQIGQVTTYSYNDLYFLLGRSYPSLVNDTFTYDLSGRMLTGRRGAWLVTFTYDGADRVLETTQDGQAVGYSYDIPGRTRTMTYPGGRRIVELTDVRARLSRIDDALSPPPIVQYTYDLGNRPTSRAYRNDTHTTYTYNANDWAMNLEHTRGSTRVAGFGYAYDNEGNKQFEEQRHHTTRSEAYQYDVTNRLIEYKVGTLVGSTVPMPSTQTAYDLDPVGNWASKTTDGTTETRVHDAVNELVQIDDRTLTYDPDGNLQVDDTFTYTYDEENRLIRVRRNTDSAIVGWYQYDALGRRVVKVASASDTFTTTRYFYDDTRAVEEQDDRGATQATYVYGNYVDETLTMDRGGQTYYYHQNALWSVEAVTDRAGNAVERYSYDAYGSPNLTDGAGVPVPPNPWGTAHSAIGNSDLFTGRQMDEETGLYFYRARYDDPVKGRFLSRDPLNFNDGAPNAYEYAGSRPTFGIDPLGLATPDDFKKACAANKIPDHVCNAILEVLEKTWIVPLGPETCQRWANDFEEKLDAKGLNLHGHRIGSGKTVFSLNAFGGLTTAHAAYTLVFPNGDTFYFDNGCLNGSHISTPAEVPKGWTSTTEAFRVAPQKPNPKDAPCGYFCCECGQEVDWAKVILNDEELGPFRPSRVACKERKSNTKESKFVIDPDLSSACSNRCGSNRRFRVVPCEETDKGRNDPNRDDVKDGCLPLRR
jgi:RHS repeat-associated protein